MKIGIFGGSFNPIHNMHLKIANYLIENKYLDKIIFVPTGDKYSYKTHMLEADKRLIMINLAIKDNPNILSSDYEIKNQMVYTYETLNYFKELYHNDKIYFVCGMDNLNYLDKWQKPEEILKFPIIVVNRNKEKMNSKFLNYKNIKQVKIKLSSLSSTLIRQKIKEFSHSDIGIGITGKLARADKNNNYGKDNQVFINIIYHDKSYDYTLSVSGKNRVTSKNEVATFLSNKLNNILS